MSKHATSSNRLSSHKNWWIIEEGTETVLWDALRHVWSNVSAVNTKSIIYTFPSHIYYSVISSPVHVCYHDAERHFLVLIIVPLQQILIRQGINLFYVRLLVYWYCKQTFCMKWVSILSPCFTITMGLGVSIWITCV